MRFWYFGWKSWVHFYFEIRFSKIKRKFKFPFTHTLPISQPLYPQPPYTPRLKQDNNHLNTIRKNIYIIIKKKKRKNEKKEKNKQKKIKQGTKRKRKRKRKRKIQRKRKRKKNRKIQIKIVLIHQV